MNSFESAKRLYIESFIELQEKPYQIYGPDPHGPSDGEKIKIGKPYKDKKRAKSRADKLDQEIGGYRHSVHRVAEDSDPCWKGYRQVGMKIKNGRQVPNCVKRKVATKVKTEEYRELPLDKMKKAARKHELRSAAWGILAQRRNSGVSGVARAIGRKLRGGPSSTDRYIDAKQKTSSLRSKLISTVANHRIDEPEDFESGSKQASAENKARGAKNSIRRIRR